MRFETFHPETEEPIEVDYDFHPRWRSRSGFDEDQPEAIIVNAVYLAGVDIMDFLTPRQAEEIAEGTMRHAKELAARI